jgi:transposase, IS30 family
MGKHYNQLDQSKRDRLSALKNEGHSNRSIARTLNIDHSTVGREINRNSYGDDGRTPDHKKQTYDPESAQHKTYTRRKYAKYQGKHIHEDHRIESFIKTNVMLGWTPDEMGGYMKIHYDQLGFYASKTAIYEWFYSVHGQPYCTYLPSKQSQPKKRAQKKTDRVLIPDKIPISRRPEAVDDRTEVGHWEHDTIVSSKPRNEPVSTHNLGTAQERVSRLLRAHLEPSLSPTIYAEGLTRAISDDLVLSMTGDNGIENTEHAYVTGNHKDAPVMFFTDPYSPWQKGGIENANRMLRRYFPKGTNFANVTQEQVDRAVLRINKKPRRCLGYKSALQYAKEKGVIQ